MPSRARPKESHPIRERIDAWHERHTVPADPIGSTAPKIARALELALVHKICDATDISDAPSDPLIVVDRVNNAALELAAELWVPELADYSREVSRRVIHRAAIGAHWAVNQRLNNPSYTPPPISPPLYRDPHLIFQTGLLKDLRSPDSGTFRRAFYDCIRSESVIRHFPNATPNPRELPSTETEDRRSLLTSVFTMALENAIIQETSFDKPLTGRERTMPRDSEEHTALVVQEASSELIRKLGLRFNGEEAGIIRELGDALVHDLHEAISGTQTLGDDFVARCWIDDQTWDLYRVLNEAGAEPEAQTLEALVASEHNGSLGRQISELYDETQLAQRDEISVDLSRLIRL